MACLRARWLPPVLALLVVAVCAALGSPQPLGLVGEVATPLAPSLRATAPAIEAVLPLKLERPADRVGHPDGIKHRVPLGLAAVAVGLPALAVGLGAGRRTSPVVYRLRWFTPPPSRGPPAPQLVAT